MLFRAALCEAPEDGGRDADHGRGLFEAFRRRTIEDVRVLGEARVLSMHKLPVAAVMMEEENTGQVARPVRPMKTRDNEHPRAPVSRVRAEGSSRVGLSWQELGPNLPIGPVDPAVLIKATNARKYEPAQGLRGVARAVKKEALVSRVDIEVPGDRVAAAVGE